MIASVTYNTSGSAGPYTVTFPYLQPTDVDVYLDGVLKTYITDWTFASGTTILLNVAPSATVIELRRSTSNTAYVNFTDPGSLTETDLDTATLQAIYIAQEAVDADARTYAFYADLAADLAAAVVVAGNVPSPADPGDNNKILKALNGAWAWAAAFVASAGITDASTVGKAILTAANAAAVRTEAVAAKQETVQALTSSATITIDASLGDYFTLVAAHTFTLANPTNPTNGKRIMLRVKQDGTGSRVMTLGTAFRLGTDILAVVLSTAIDKVDYLGFVYDSTDAKWDVVAFVKGY